MPLSRKAFRSNTLGGRWFDVVHRHAVSIVRLSDVEEAANRGIMATAAI